MSSPTSDPWSLDDRNDRHPQIGACLFISRGTVKTHLSHIFTKLEIANRTELAAAATDRGLPISGRSRS